MQQPIAFLLEARVEDAKEHQGGALLSYPPS